MSAIELRGITKQFIDGDETIDALKETNVAVEAGEFVAIIGPSGSGKSTLLTIIGGLQTPSTGEVLINGASFSSESEKKRARRRFDDIGFILQSSNLVPFLTVKQQFQLVDDITKKKQSERREMLLERLGVERLVNKYPSELSGGERQRIAIARALYHQPAVILADEPTASLDSERAFEVVELLAEATKQENKATIMVTHDTRLIQACDRVLRMQDGKLTEE